MGVVTGGVVGTAFHGGTITEGLTIADPDAAETQLTITGTGSTSGAKLIDTSAVHTAFAVDSDGILSHASDDSAYASITGTSDSGAELEVLNNPTAYGVQVNATSGSAGVGVHGADFVPVALIGTSVGLLVALHSAPADGGLVAGQCSIWFDQTNGASKLMVKAKSANGTVVTGSLALA